MTPEDLKELAAQLRLPSGELGAQVAAGMTKGNAVIVDRAFEALAVEPGHSVLEVGSGSGELAARVVEAMGPDGAYAGVEHAPDMARLTEERLGSSVSARVVVGAYGAPHVDQQLGGLAYDRFVAVNVLYFVERLDDFFESAYRHLRPGGQVVLGVRSQLCLDQLPFTKHGFISRSLDIYLTALAAAGFEGPKAAFLQEKRIVMGDKSYPMDSVIIQARRKTM
ncbi:MAG: methyltransferase [Myxococcota bacterium]